MMFPEDLLKSLANGRVHLFVGSGVSKAAALIGWDDLIREMITVIRRESDRFPKGELTAFLRKGDCLDIADIFRQTVDDHRYFQFLRERYRRPVSISRLHKVLSRFPVNTIFTTNFDKLLEITFRRMGGIDPAVVIYAEQLGYIENSELKIIKLHGDIDHPSSIVLTRSDYAKYAGRHRDFVSALESSINNCTVLFVGFGLRDWNFKRIYQDARALYDSTKRLAYAIMAGTNAIERRLWEKDGLKILPTNGHRQTVEYLDKMVRALRRRGHP